jgi:hypothetical protein
MKRMGMVPATVLRNDRRVQVLDSPQVEALEDELGFAPHVDGYEREDLFVLDALNLSPYGFRSVHAVSRAASISATTAAKVVARLTQRGLIIVSPQRELLNRKVVTVSTLRANRHHKEWRRLSGQIAAVRLPPESPTVPKIVPRRFWHLFWNADPLRLPIAEHADFIATRMLLSDEPQAIAWAAINLPPNSIERAADMRSTPEEDRQWFRSLAMAMSSED